MTYESIFNSPEFDNRFDHLMVSIKEYLNETQYDLGNLEIKEIIDSEYDKAIIVTLFKNKTKCEHIVGKITVANNVYKK